TGGSIATRSSVQRLAISVPDPGFARGVLVRRRNRSPIEIRRLSYVIMVLASMAGGWAGATEGPVAMIAVLVLSVAATACYVRAADLLLDFDYRRTRRQAVLFAIVGMAAALVGCVVASQVTNGSRSELVRALGYAAIGGGIAVGL